MSSNATSVAGNLAVSSLLSSTLEELNRSALNLNRQMAIPSFKLLANTLFTLKYTHFCTPIVIVNNQKLEMSYITFRLDSIAVENAASPP
jgi:hypothetical protein